MSAALAAIDVQPRVVAIATRRHGSQFDPTGLDAVRSAEIVESGRTLGGAPSRSFGSAGSSGSPDRTESTAELVRRWRPAGPLPVVVETTTLDVTDGEPAVSHIEAAFAAGAHVISANKGPVACAYRRLAASAARARREWLFEGAVMDGIPIFSLVRRTLPAAEIRGFRGVVNSTTNYLIDAMEQGESFEAALRRMQDAGVAEADPSLDIDGWDAAAKIAAMANVWFDADIRPSSVARDVLTPQLGERARRLRAEGRRLKMVASATRDAAGSVAAAVRLDELASDDPLAILDGQANALELDTWPAGRIVITQRDGGLEKTAYALLADLCHLRSLV